MTNLVNLKPLDHMKSQSIQDLQRRIIQKSQFNDQVNSPTLPN